MSLPSALVSGWPIFAAMGFAAILTYGAIRPYIKKDKERLEKRKELEK